MGKIIESRIIDPDKVRAECIAYHWFTNANCAEYDKFLDRVYHQHDHASLALLKWMAERVMQYSDPNTYEDLGLTGIMFVFANQCCVSCFAKEDN